MVIALKDENFSSSSSIAKVTVAFQKIQSAANGRCTDVATADTKKAKITIPVEIGNQTTSIMLR